ncbi:MAG TPA: hypothetical protein DEB40_08910 [Elusimicrobia bacterium]|nr:hypothetical protein [Elusimicrobiota bacterium]HBT61848.1 hypothetical protein [Elusimicrobiota bacterium]
MTRVIAPSLLLFGVMCAWAEPPKLPPREGRAIPETADKGMRQEQTASAVVGGVPLAAVLFRNPAKNLNKLAVYATLKGKSYLVYTHPSFIDRLKFDPALPGQGFLDLFADGSRAIVYHATTPGLNTRTLYVLRCQGPRVRRVGSFPQGELRALRGAGRPVIVSQTLALGRYFSVGCENFYAMSQNAYQTRIYEWRKGDFIDASTKFPDFFAEKIKGLEDRLALIPKEKQPGEYLGGVVALYYDYAAQGRPRQGWNRLSSLLKPPPYAFPKLSACLSQVQADLRRKLDIPPDW